MRTLALATITGMLICISSDELNAQGEVRATAEAASTADGLDGFWDYIHRLSGPLFEGIGGSLTSGRLTGSPPDFRGDWRVRLRLGGARHEDANYTTSLPSGDTASIKMLTVELDAELGHRRLILVLGPIAVIPEIGAGAARHSFSADNPALDDFSHWSFPTYAQLRVPIPFIRLPVSGTIKGRVGKRIFPPFPDGAFSATSTNVLEDKWEAPWFFSLGVQIHR